jgi:hypothetical protein
MSDQDPKLFQEQLEQFRVLVLRDPELQARLRGLSDRQTFIERMLQLSAELGYFWSAKQIETALAMERRDWNQRRSVR